MLTCDSYITAHTLDEAFAAMAANVASGRFVAGGTDLLPWAREGRAGDVHISTLGQGLGIEVDETALRHFRCAAPA
jgi:CO/xanthine dehydrogenase FAD-binding subunit